MGRRSHVSHKFTSLLVNTDINQAKPRIISNEFKLNAYRVELNSFQFICVSLEFR
jgi:hypothetical protein